MGSIMSAEQGARLFVKILAERRCEAGVPIQNAIAGVWAVEAGLDGSELDEALKFAGEKEWLRTGIGRAPSTSRKRATPLGAPKGASQNKRRAPYA
jgi:hypothetical protein